MAGAGKKTFAVNEVLSAADVNNYLMDQSVMRFADSTARSSAIGTPSEGMVSYLDDSNQVEVFDGSSWVNFTGDITQVTAGTALTGGGTEGNVTLNVDETELFTGGTAGYTALSNGTAGLSYQPVSHNYVINGAMEVDQRGTAFPSVGNDEYTLDRWAVKFVDSVDKSTDTPSNDFAFSSKVTTGTNTFPDFYQRIEAENATFLYGKDFTISFWIKANQALVDLDTARVQFYTADSKNNFSSETIFDSYFFNADLVADTWVKVEGTVLAGNVPTAIANGLRVNIRTATNTAPATSGEFYITGVQLEAGSIATPFKRNANSIAGELAACQRYYYRMKADGESFAFLTSGYAVSTTRVYASVRLPVQMRARPSAVKSGNLGLNDVSSLTAITSLSAGGYAQTTQVVNLLCDVSSGLTDDKPYAVITNNDPDAYIEFIGAEL